MSKKGISNAMVIGAAISGLIAWIVSREQIIGVLSMCFYADMMICGYLFWKQLKKRQNG